MKINDYVKKSKNPIAKQQTRTSCLLFLCRLVKMSKACYNHLDSVVFMINYEESVCIMEKVDILLSIYNPNMEYLQLQLQSLDRQTYDNLEILVFDDCVSNRCDLAIFEQCLKNKSYKILPYKDENQGYTKAFEYLVSESDGDYVAFCDQDDIWDETKIEKCVACLKQDKSLVVTTDRRIIDAKGHVIKESIRHTSTKNFDTWKSFDDIGKYNFFANHTIGMGMVVNGDFVRSTIPFCVHTGHDKWVTCCACAMGTVSFLDEVLVSYRRHGLNVSGVLNGVTTKKEYKEERILPHLYLVEEFKTRYPNYHGTEEALEFAHARVKGDIRKILKYSYLAPDIAKFEILLTLLPGAIVKIAIKILQKIM